MRARIPKQSDHDIAKNYGASDLRIGRLISFKGGRSVARLWGV